MTEQLDRLAAAIADRYTIEEELGTGGMATVYLAHDVKHNRKVAIKVLRPELAAILGAERFLKEIEVTANLQHPHILPLFDSGEADSFLYYVMPFIDGESLRDKLDRETQLGVDEAVKIASDVADALDYAHRHNVIHRDIKPENILLHDGRPLVADFGIALAVSAAAGGRMTETGLSLGTPHYMSPEQATAEKDLSNRSDIYSLGCVLYEMLAGDPPHVGPNAQAIIMKIVTEEPRPVTDLRRSVPYHVAASLTKALEKLPADRFESASAFGRALDDESFEYVQPDDPKPSRAKTTHRRRRGSRSALAFDLPSAAVVLFALLAGGALHRWLVPSPDSPIVRFELPAVLSPFGNGVAISADDRTVAFRASDGIYVRVLSEVEARLIPGTEDAESVSLSPDGQWVVYQAGNGLYRLPAEGGAAVLLTDDVFGFNQGAIWSLDDYVYYRISEGIARVPAAGGAPDTVARGADAGDFISWPWPLPDGRHLLVSHCDNSGCRNATVALFDIETGESSVLQTGVTRGWYVLPGYLAFARADGAIYVASLDVGAMALNGAPIPVLDSVTTNGGGAAQLAVSPSGSLVYNSGRSAFSAGSVVRIDRGGEETTILREDDRGYREPRVSPDGLRLAFTEQRAELSTSRVGVLSFEDANRVLIADSARSPEWSPDGSEIAYVRVKPDRDEVWVKRWDGAGTPRAVAVTLQRVLWTMAWMPDGNTLLVPGRRYENDRQRIYAVPVDGEDDPAPLFDSPGRQRNPSVSPDGRWLAYLSDESGAWQVYVRPLDGSGGRYAVSGEIRETWPRWGPDSRTVYYLGAGDALPYALQGARLSLGDEVTVENRERFPQGDGTREDFDVSPDGEFFYRVRAFRGGDDGGVRVVLNWAKELEERVGR